MSALTMTVAGLCVPAAFGAFLVGQSILSEQHLQTTLGEPGVTRAVLGSALYLGGVGLLGLGLGALLRNTAGAACRIPRRWLRGPDWASSSRTRRCSSRSRPTCWAAATLSPAQPART